MFGQEFFQRAIVWGPVILFSLTLHEFFHAWTALRFGDTTARDQGRLTLNPLAHLDPMGTIVMVLSQFTFGWAKPVPVNPWNLRNPRVADIWISAAGPLSNIGLAIVAGVLYQIFVDPSAAGVIGEWFRAAVFINITLALFNLLPVFPLDGSHILGNLLPTGMQEGFQRFNQFAPFLLLIIIVSGLFWRVLGPVVIGVATVLMGH